jgi:hypothetical protein
MGADDDRDCQHMWRLSRMLIDGRGTFFVNRCDLCAAVAVEPASGDSKLRADPLDRGR